MYTGYINDKYLKRRYSRNLLLTTYHEENPLSYNKDISSCSPLFFEDDEKVFDFSEGRLITVKTARRVIHLLNTFNERMIIQAFFILFNGFIWEINKIHHSRRLFIKFKFISPIESDSIKPLRFEHTRITKKNTLDSVKTSATNGVTLWINKKAIMNKSFDNKDTHFGELPGNVSHFSAVMLHEFGHILRDRVKETTVPYMFSKSPIVKKCMGKYMNRVLDARNEKERTEKEDEMEEWFADIFSKSFILFANGNTRK